MKTLNSTIQSNATELLQAIVSRGEIERASLESIETAAIGKLYFSIHMNHLDLQNKWLHLLHSVISASILQLESARRTEIKGEDAPLESGTVPDNKTNDIAFRYPVNPLMVQTLVDGIATRQNRPVLQHWLDFILMAVPQFQPALQTVVTPLNDCLCRQTLTALGDVLKMTAQTREYMDDMRTTVTDAELIMLLNALERLILLSLAYTSDVDSSEDDPNVPEKVNTEASGLLGYVSNVFSSEGGSSHQADQLTVSNSLSEDNCSKYTSSLVLRAIVLWMMESASFTLYGPRSYGKHPNLGHRRMRHFL